MKTRTALYIDSATLAAIDARIDGVHVPSRNAFIVRAVVQALNVRVIALPIAAWGHNGAAGLHLNLNGTSPVDRLQLIASTRQNAIEQGLDTVFTYG